MRCQHLLIRSTVVLVAVIAIACTLNQEQTATYTAAGKVKKEETTLQEIPPEVCKMLAGDWGTFETPQGVQKKRCGNLPCGYRGPIKLDCHEGKITGSKLLMYASHPLPEREIRAPIDAFWTDGKIVLKYTDSQKCSVTYMASVTWEELVGEYQVLDCGNKETRGDFLAKRFPLHWTTNK